jgi:hypothetical protein
VPQSRRVAATATKNEGAVAADGSAAVEHPEALASPPFADTPRSTYRSEKLSHALHVQLIVLKN